MQCRIWPSISYALLPKLRWAIVFDIPFVVCGALVFVPSKLKPPHACAHMECRNVLRFQTTTSCEDSIAIPHSEIGIQYLCHKGYFTHKHFFFAHTFICFLLMAMFAIFKGHYMETQFDIFMKMTSSICRLLCVIFQNSFNYFISLNIVTFQVITLCECEFQVRLKSNIFPSVFGRHVFKWIINLQRKNWVILSIHF